MPNGMRGRDLPPPPVGGAMRGGPAMPRDSGAGVGDLMSKMAGRGAGGQGGSPDEQSAALIMAAAQQLVQAAMLNPALEDSVRRAIGIIQEGVSTLAGAGMGRGGERPRRKRSSKREPIEGEGEMGGMGGAGF